MAKGASRQLNIRIPPDLMSTLEEIASEEHLDRGAVVRRLLLDGARRWRLEQALKLYREDRITKERAAEIAGVSLYDRCSDNVLDTMQRQELPPWIRHTGP